MSKEANNKLIGVFVVGAIMLVVAGVMLFGSGKWLKPQSKFVLFFDGSVKGLGIGAPVDFKGVKVGSVASIRIVLDKKDQSLRIPVFIELDPRSISHIGSKEELEKAFQGSLKGEKNFIELLVENGLKAELEMQSLVTGQLGIQLDFFPDQPARFIGAEPEYTEIPTVESRLSGFVKTVHNLPLEEIAQKVSKALDGIIKLENSPELRDGIASLAPAVKSGQALFKNLDDQIKPLANDTKLTIGEAKKMFANASKLATDLDARIPQIVESLNETLKTTSVTMKGANKAIDGIAGDNSPVRIELVKTLDEVASASRSLRLLADYIEQNPEALIRGKRR